MTRSATINLLFALTRWVLVLLALGYVGFRIWHDRAALGQIIKEADARMGAFILLSVLLLPLNIWLEAEKWRRVVAPFYPSTSLSIAFRAVLAGMATGIFTPNRIGDYAGRVLYLEPGHRLEAVALSFINRASQMLITLISGWMALLWLSGFPEVRSTLPLFEEPWLFGLLITGVSFNILLILVFFVWPVKVWSRLEKRLGRWEWGRRLGLAVRALSPALVRSIIGLSLLRFLVFSTQFYLLLLAFGFEENIGVAYALISIIFLGKSIFPYLGLGELGVREAVSIAVLGLVGFDSVRAFNCSLLLYLINIVAPTLAGVVFLRGLRLGGKEESK